METAHSPLDDAILPAGESEAALAAWTLDELDPPALDSLRSAWARNGAHAE